MVGREWRGKGQIQASIVLRTNKNSVTTGVYPPENSPRKVPPRLFPPETFPPTKPGFAKYAVDENLFLLESSILTRAKRATNRNTAAINRKKYTVFWGVKITWGNIPGWNVPAGIFWGGVYLEPTI